MKLKELISPSFYTLHRHIKKNSYTHFWIKGGRGSTKSSFVSIEIILGIMANEGRNAVAVRRVGNSIKDSVYSQLLWAIEKLNVSHLWESKKTAPELIYKPTGQKILFRGADDVTKIKSTKTQKGYIAYVWFEEASEFKELEDILSVNQSLLRGGEKFVVFYTYNPPKDANHWINSSAFDEREDKIVHHSTYLDTPRSWLGEQFFIEADNLKKRNPMLYSHQYLGKCMSLEGQILTNYEIKDFEADFDVEFLGQDFGFNHANCILHLGFTDEEIYIIKENYVKGKDTIDIMKEVEGVFNKNLIMFCDSAEPDRINMWRKGGYRAVPVSKEKNSVKAQIDFLMSKKIIIHPSCQNTIREISSWCWLKDKGSFTDLPTPVNDDAMAALRYGVEYMRKL